MSTKGIYLLMNLLLFSSFFYVSLIICPPSTFPRMIFFVTQQEFMVLSSLFQVNFLSWPSVFLFSPAYFFFSILLCSLGPPLSSCRQNHALQILLRGGNKNSSHLSTLIKSLCRAWNLIKMLKVWDFYSNQSKDGSAFLPSYSLLQDNNETITQRRPEANNLFASQLP